VGYCQGTRGLACASEVDAVRAKREESDVGRAVSNPFGRFSEERSGGDVRILGPSTVFSRRRVAGSTAKTTRKGDFTHIQPKYIALGVDSSLIVRKGRID
jgi:hypothetical protein